MPRKIQHQHGSLFFPRKRDGHVQELRCSTCSYCTVLNWFRIATLMNGTSDM